MTNLSLPSDPRSWVPRHTVAEWFQMKGVCRATGLWRSSFIAANSHFPSLANPLLVAKDGSAAPDYPYKSCNWRWAARWRRHFFSPQTFRAPAKAVQSHVRARAPQREASVRLHYQMTPQPVHHSSANSKVCELPTKIQANPWGQAKGINKPTKEKNRCTFKCSQLTCQVTLRLTCG